MKVLALSLWKKLSWDLTYFDEFTLEPPQGEAVLMCSHNLGLRAKIRKIMYTPINMINTSFTI